MRNFVEGDSVTWRNVMDHEHRITGTVINVVKTTDEPLFVCVRTDAGQKVVWAISNLIDPLEAKIYCPECEEEDYPFVDDYVCAACRCFLWDS